VPVRLLETVADVPVDGGVAGLLRQRALFLDPSMAFRHALVQ
jgi:hypothetical protein